MPEDFDAFTSGVGGFVPEEVPPQPTTPDDTRYLQGGLLGRGGMGEVRAAQDVRLGREVAFKRAHDLALLPRMVREARITAQLEHPGIVPVYDAGTDDEGRPFYTMRMVRGRSLTQVASEATDLQARLGLLRSMLSTCEAVAFAHALGVVHRDLKPANIMLGAFGEVQVVDWGLASVLPEELERWGPVLGELPADSEGMAGTPAYMSPEAASGAGASRASDVWSLGVMLYELLAGETLWRGESWEEVLGQVRYTPPDISRLQALDVGPDLVAIVRKALREAPSERYPDAGALAQDLQRFLDGRLVGAYAYSPLDHLRRLLRLWKAPLTVAAVAVVLLALLGAESVRRITTSRDDAVAAQRVAEQARSETQDTLSHALLQQARQSLLAGNRAVAELNAARALTLQSGPVARGVLAAYAASPRPRRLSTQQLPACERWSLAPTSGLAACSEARRYGVYDIHAQKWVFQQELPNRVLSVVITDTMVVPTYVRDDSIQAELRDPATGEMLLDDFRVIHQLRLGAGEASIVFSNGYAATIVSREGVRQYPDSSFCPGKMDGVSPFGVDRWVMNCVGEGFFHTSAAMDMVAWPGTEGMTSDRLLVVDGLLIVGMPSGQLFGLDASGALRFDRHFPFIVSSMTPWGDLVLLVDEVGRVMGMEPQTGQILWTLPVGAVTPRALARDGEHLLVLERDMVSTWELPPTGERLFFSPDGLSSASFDDAGRWLATANGAGVVTVWDLQTHQERLVTGLVDDLAVVKWLDISPLEQRLTYSGMSAPWLYQQDFDGEKEPMPDSSPMRRLAYFANGTVSLLNYSQEPWFLMARDGRSEPQSLEGPCEDMEPDFGRSVMAAACQGGRVVLLQADGTHQTVATFPAVQAVAPSSGGEEVVIAEEERVRIVRADGEVLESFDHPYRLLDVAISPDGSRLASGAQDGVVRVFSRDGKVLLELQGHTRRVPFVRFTSDGASLWSASWDGVARQWGLDVLDQEPAALQDTIEQDWGLTLEDL